MADKRIVMKEGFWVDGRSIKPCHFSSVVTVDMWDISSNELLTLVDGAIHIIREDNNEVFVNLHDAERLSASRRDSHVKWCEGQVAYYQEQIDKEG